LGLTDKVLLDHVSSLEVAVKSAQEKATQLESMPVREFVVAPRVVRTDLVAMLDSVVDLAKGLGSRRDVAVRWMSRLDHAVYCDLDPRYMPVALHAIFDNAVKYSFRGMRVDVSLSLSGGDFAVLLVSNLGVGIKPSERATIFEFGKRGAVEDAKGGERRGSGLGLPFAKRIIRAQGGSIEIESYSSLESPPQPDDYLSHVVNVTIKMPLARRT
jgi:two-component system OmpR family sensor kinase